MGAGARARSEAEGRAARRVPACACRPHGRGAHAAAAELAASDLREEGRRASRAVAGAGCTRGSAAPLDRRERDADERKVASSPEAPVPARAATGRRRRAQAREAPPQDASHSSPLHARRGDPREARRAKGGCRGGGGGCATHQRAICHGAALLRRPSQPPRPERAPTDQRA
jgi:hypothetical protein